MEVERETSIVFSNSSTQSVGYYPVSELAEVRYPSGNRVTQSARIQII